MHIDGEEIHGRIYSYDFLRLIATILIVFHHYQGNADFFIEGNINFSGGRFYFGYVVEFFFLLSGIMAAQNIDKIKGEGVKFKQFYLAKLLRFLPLTAISAVVYEGLLFFYLHLFGRPFRDIKINIFGIIIDALGIQTGWSFQNPCVNNPTWYISVLLLSYIWFFLLTYLAMRWRIPEIYLYTVMIFLGIGVSVYQINFPFFNTYAARGYYAFFYGIIIAKLVKKKISKAAFGISFILVIAITICFVKGWLYDDIQYMLTFVYYPAIIVLFSSEWIRRRFYHAVWGWIGKITFDVYIWHAGMLIAMYMIPEILKKEISFGSYYAMFVFTIAAFGVGAISYFVIEMPMNRFIEKRKYI